MASNYFFFLKPIQQILLGVFWWALLMAFILFVPFLRVWWWVLFPLILIVEVRTLYFWYMNWDYYYAKTKWVMLEIVPPKEVLTPLKAMEDIFTIMWAANYQPPNWREEWCEGVIKFNPAWMSWEIVSIEGKLHFYARIMAGQRSVLETALYGHYPEIEIIEAQDYTRGVPQNIPNKEWDVWGEDFVLTKNPALPIRTYEKFFEPQGEKISAEEKRIDPLSSLLELMSKLGTGEQFWLQFIVASDDGTVVKEHAEALIAKLSKRPVKKKPTFFQELALMGYHLVMGPAKEGSGEKASYKWLEASKSESGEREMILTPEEREKLTEVENKAKRPISLVNIRGVYVAKRENFNSAHKSLTRAYFAHFSGFNGIKFTSATRPKTQYFFRKSIPYVRARRQFRNYIMRFTPKFPDRKSEMAYLNTEELATIYHFPLKITGLVAPTMTRVESKKGGPPPNLPM